MLPLEHLDRIQITFDDHRLVNNAGLLLPATLALNLGLRQLVDHHLDLGDAPGRANAGDKMMTLIASALAGGDCIDDADALRAGGTAGVLDCTVKAPSTLGTFPAQLPLGPRPPAGPGEPRVAGPCLGRWGGTPATHHSPSTWTPPSARPTGWPRRALATTAIPASGAITRCWPWPLAPATCCWPVCARAGPTPLGAPPTFYGRRWGGCATPGPRDNSPCGPTAVSTLMGWYPSAARQRSRFSITIRQRASLRNLIEAIPEDAWTPIPYWMEGAADVAETAYTPFGSKPDAAPVRLIVRRVKPAPGSQLALFASYSYHGFITDRDGDTLDLEADHRRHAEIENAIRDLKYGVGLNHLPSGRFAANAAWLAVQVMAYNLARWTARIGLGEQIVTTKTLRRRFFSLAGRLTRKARRLTLHLPRRWPWEAQFSSALARLRSLPLPS